MRYIGQSRGLRALSVGILFAIVIGLISTSHLFQGSESTTQITVLVPTVSISALQVISDAMLTTVSVPRSALPALGADPVSADQRTRIIGSVARTTLPAHRVIDLSDLYDHGSSATSLLRPYQALYTLPLPSLSYPLPSLIPDSYVDIHGLISHPQPGSGTDATSSQAQLLVSKARVYQVAPNAVTVVVLRSDVPALNLMRTIGTYSFAEVSPEAPSLSRISTTSQQILGDAHGTR